MNNLTNGVLYNFRFKAKNSRGYWSEYTNEVSGQPIDNVDPPTPLGLKINSVDDRQASLGWTVVRAADLAGYQLEYKTAEDLDWIGIPVGKVTTYTVTG
ncbi:hypothetical protein [Desulfitobacterium sp. THU1]|uniref:hypothetical protein n=1 Tax=Desulfitobacterium sp. THU1 TaxID=3138072 RepID=UPI00404922E8